MSSSPKVYTTRWAFMQLERPLRSGAVALHINCYTFCARYICHQTLIHHQIQKFHDRLRTRETIRFVSSFIAHVHYLHLVFPQLLIFRLSCFPSSCSLYLHVQLFTYLPKWLATFCTWIRTCSFFLSKRTVISLNIIT